MWIRLGRGIQRQWKAFGVWRYIVPVELLVLVAVVGYGVGANELVLLFFVVFGAAVALVTAMWTRTATTSQQAQIDRQAGDIAFLAEVARREQAQQPAPVVEALDPAGAGPSFTYVRPLRVVPDRDRVVASGVAGMANSEARPKEGEGWGTLFAKMWDEDNAKVQADLPTYAAKLGDWVDSMSDYLTAAYQLVRVPLRFRNAGGATLEDGRVVLSLPVPLSAAEEAYPPGDPPEKPHRRFDRLGGILRTAYQPILPHLDFAGAHGNVQGPYADVGATEVTYTVEQLLHGLWDDAVDGAELQIAVPEDGDFPIVWQVYARNMREPTTGTITVHVRTDPPNSVLAITELAMLMELHRGGEEEAG